LGFVPALINVGIAVKIGWIDKEEGFVSVVESEAPFLGRFSTDTRSIRALKVRRDSATLARDVLPPPPVRDTP